MECDIVDYSVYENKADLRSDELLREALKRQGVGTRVMRLTGEGVAGSLAENVWLRYDLRSLRDLSFVIGFAGQLRALGHRVFPDPTSILQSEDKWASYLAFKSSSVPTLDTCLFGKVTGDEGPGVVKPRVGWGGMGMRIVAPGEMNKGLLAEADGDHIWQPFVDHVHTWTVAAWGDRKAILLEKRAKGNDFRTNSEFGEEARLVDDPGGLGLLGQRALDAVGLPVGTADLMEVDGTAVVLEVNSAPCLWYDQLPDLDLVGPMGRAVTKWLGGLTA